MHYRTLGRTGLEVSEISFGAWGIGGALWKGSDDRESMRSLHRAADLGVNFIDTALVYGDGHSERLIASFLKERKERILVATKIPPKNDRWPADPATSLRDVFPHDYIVACTERSLKHLGVDTIDIQQFHVWTDSWVNEAEWSDAISLLKEQGKIRHFGISINDHQPASVLAVGGSGKVDTFQVIYNIFDQSPERELFPLCREKNIGVIVRVPFDEGGLTGTITPATTFDRGDFRHSYFRGDRKREVQERAERLKQLLGDEASSLPELALRFCLNHDAVSTVIPGMRTVHHVELNAAAADGRRLTPTLMATLRAHTWERNFYR